MHNIPSIKISSLQSPELCGRLLSVSFLLRTSQPTVTRSSPQDEMKQDVESNLQLGGLASNKLCISRSLIFWGEVEQVYNSKTMLCRSQRRMGNVARGQTALARTLYVYTCILYIVYYTLYSTKVRMKLRILSFCRQILRNRLLPLELFLLVKCRGLGPTVLQVASFEPPQS